MSEPEQFEPATPRRPSDRRLRWVSVALFINSGLGWSAGAVLTSGGVFAGCVVAAIICFALAWAAWPPQRRR